MNDNNFRTLGIYADGMVLQRNTVNCIFGDGASGEVKLSFKDVTVTAAAAPDGTWKIEYNPGEAGGPQGRDLRPAGGIGPRLRRTRDRRKALPGGRANAAGPVEGKAGGGRADAPAYGPPHRSGRARGSGGGRPEAGGL